MKMGVNRNAHHLHVGVKASCWLLLNLGICLNIVCITHVPQWKMFNAVTGTVKEQLIWLYCGYGQCGTCLLSTFSTSNNMN